MTNFVNLRQLLLGSLLLVPALNCAALSLDRAKGAAWLGRPLDVSVLVRMDSGENPGTLCPSADIFQGDTRVRPSLVSVTAEPGPGNEETLLHVRSTAPVDEPVVTIYLKVGCTQGMTRRYVLLAEIPPEALVESTRTSRLPSLMKAPSRSGASTNSTFESQDSAMASTGKSRPEPISRRAESSAKTRRPAGDDAAAPLVSPQRVPSVARRKKTDDEPRGRGRPRLELDPAELLAERDPVLRSSMELLSMPDDSPTRRAEAVALWRAIRATPEDVLKTQQQLQALGADVETLRNQSRKSESLITGLHTQLRQAQAERYGNPLVYSLLVLLLLALASVAYFWGQRRSSAKQHWWNASPDIPGNGTPEQSNSASVSGTQPPETMAQQDSQDTPPPPDTHGAHPAPRPSPPKVPNPPVPVPVQVAMPGLDRLDFDANGTGRAVKVDELFDVQQQADFFISLGEYDKAIATLTDHIAENPETSALAYLDLLEIYHMQGREQEYDAVRQEFSSAFNAEVPAFEDFGVESRGLESYETAMSRITALWPASKVLDVIEESVFRKPGGGHPAFDLDAYRELLLLYAVATEIVETRDSVRKPESTDTTPVPAGKEVEPSMGVDEKPPFQTTYIEPLVAAQPLDADSAASPELDVDLTKLATESPQLPVSTPAPAEQSNESASGSASLANGARPLIDFDVFDLPPRKSGPLQHNEH